MTSMDVGRFLVLNPVRTDRAEDFERFVRQVLQPAVEAQQPGMADKVRLWRAAEAESGDGDVTIYAFVAESGNPDTLDLSVPFRAHYGDERAAELLDEFNDFFVEFDTWKAGWRAIEDPEEGPARQYWWEMREVPMR
jgi:hypothetical protein